MEAVLSVPDVEDEHVVVRSSEGMATLEQGRILLRNRVENQVTSANRGAPSSRGTRPALAAKLMA